MHADGTKGPGGPHDQRWDAHVLLEAVNDAIIAADERNRIVYANSATKNLLGWYPRELVGRPLTTIMPESLRRQHREGFERFVRTGRQTLPNHPVRLPALRADGSEVEIELTLNAFALKGGEKLIVGSLRDVTERIVLERESSVAHDLLRVVSEATSLTEASTEILEVVCRGVGWDAGGIWVVDHGSDVLRCLEFWGRPELDLASFTLASRNLIFSPGSGLPGRVWESRQAAWITDVADDPSFVRAGAAHDARLHAAFAFPIEAEGQMVGVIEFFKSERHAPDEKLLEEMAAIGRRLGTFLERRRAEEEVEFQRSLLAAESEVTLDAMLVVARTGKVCYYNRRFVEMWGVPEDVIASRSESALLRHMVGQVVDPQGFLALIRNAAAERDGRCRDELELKDGRFFDRYTAALTSPAGREYGRVWYFRDVTRQKQAERELEESRQKFANMARALQQSLLPADLPAIGGLDLAASYRPAGAGIEVGGDFYDVFATGDGEWGLMVGDVSGKGPHAAAVTALLRHTARAATMAIGSPGAVLASVNQAMWRHEVSERFCTAAYVRLRCKGNDAVVSVSSAGHPPPLLVASSGSVTPIGEPGVPLGVAPELRLGHQTVDLRPGDALVLYTDGVLEAGAPDAELGEEGLTVLLERSGAKRAEDVVAAVESAVLERTEGTPRDDVVILVVRRDPRRMNAHEAPRRESLL